jgi:hypothetical protein
MPKTLKRMTTSHTALGRRLKAIASAATAIILIVSLLNDIGSLLSTH